MVATLVKTDYKEIPLINTNLFTLVDVQDYDYLMQWKWGVTRGYRKQFYALRSYKNYHYHLHKEIACLYHDHVSSVKHLNGNTLDNRRSNLKATLRPPHPYEPKEICGNYLQLTPRQREVACFIELGLSNAEIAQKLFIDQRTVETHVWRINAAIGTNNRNQIANIVRDWKTPILIPEYQPLPRIGSCKKPIHQLKKQRLLSAQMIVDAKDAIAHQISQLQQIHADLEKTLQVMRP